MLIFAYMGLGDAIMMLPMLRAIRHALPHARIVALAMLPSPAHEILRLSGCVDRVDLFAFKQASVWKRLRLIARLQRERFDIVICPYTTPAPYFMRLIHSIPYRVGHVLPESSLRHPNVSYIFTHPVRLSYNDRKHETERYRLLAEVLGIKTAAFQAAFELAPRANYSERAEERMREVGIPGDALLLGVHPAVGETMPWRQWGIERLTAVLQHILDDYIHKGFTVCVVLFGSDADLPVLESMQQNLLGCAHSTCSRSALKVQSAVKTLLITPQHVCNSDDIPIEMTLAFLKKCHVLLANDGGIAHLAVAIGTPVVRIFGMTDYYGYRAIDSAHVSRHRDIWKGIPCSPCIGLGVVKRGYNLHTCGHHRCLNAITVQEVVEAVHNVVSASFGF